MSETNPFGGKNPLGLYVPMSEDEQEVLSRLIESEELVLHVVGWSKLYNPKVVLGDKRLSIPFKLHFNAPDVPTKVAYFDLELTTQSGLVLYTERQPTIYGGVALTVQAGMDIEAVWDIAINAIPPSVVKAIKPGSLGLTSRWQDRDTGDFDFKGGNMDLSPEQRMLLEKIQQGEQRIKQDDAQQLQKAYKTLRKKPSR